MFAECRRGIRRRAPEPRDLAMMLLERERRQVRECSVVPTSAATSALTRPAAAFCTT